ncbi:MAG: DUF4838 domain-containing protein [Victivallales bacterium]
MRKKTAVHAIPFPAGLKKRIRFFVYEYYGLSGEYPRPCDVNTLEDMRYYLSKGITRIHSEIAKGDEKRKNIGAGKNIWDANGMYYWVMTQALWNPYQDVGTLRNEYLKRVYGPAADDMRRYFKEMEAAWNATDEPVTLEYRYTEKLEHISETWRTRQMQTVFETGGNEISFTAREKNVETCCRRIE